MGFTVERHTKQTTANFSGTATNLVKTTVKTFSSIFEAVQFVKAQDSDELFIKNNSNNCYIALN